MGRGNVTVRDKDCRCRCYCLIVCIEESIREEAKDLEEGIQIGGKWIKASKFACDQTMIAKSQGVVTCNMSMEKNGED